MPSITYTELEALIEKHSQNPIKTGTSVKYSWILPEDFWEDDDEEATYTAWGAPFGETNLFYGGEIQRRAHAEGKHNYDRSETGRKSWKNRSKKEATDKMVAGYKKLLKTPEGMAQHIEKSKKGAQAAKLVIATKIRYNGKTYFGWKELKDQTGVSKYMFKKYSLGSIL